MTLPPNYNARLRRAHSTLRMRWSAQRECWFLEQQVRRAQLPKPYPGMSPDTVTRLNDGYVMIGRYEARELPPVERLIRYLNFTSVDRLGVKPEQVGAYLDDQDRSAHEASDRRTRGDLHERSKEAWDDFARREGMRSLPRANAASA